MRVRGDGWERTGTAIDLRDRDVSVEQLAQAVRCEAAAEVSVECPEPGPVHERIGVVEPSAFVSVRSTLATIARERGLNAPQEAELASVRTRLDASDTPTIDHRAIRRRVAETGQAEAELRERIATLQGQVRARRELGAETTAVESDLQTALQRWTDAETERIAAEQALERTRRLARADYDDHERRLRLVDRRENLRRAARRWLAARVHEEFTRNLRAVPGVGTAGDEPGSFEGDPVTAALALVRTATMRAPVVLSCDRFSSASTAATVLDAPVIIV
jgi:hypothetical protein